MIVHAPAKINWFLNVHGYDEASGYHQVTTVLQTLDFGDELSWHTDHTGTDVVFTASDPVLTKDPEDNLVIRAFRRFHQGLGLPVPPGIHLHLEKQIPFPAGLGGGSSDAAACLRLCARHWQAQGYVIDPKKLQSIAQTLGADVPFFLRGGTALGTGRGDVMAPLAVESAPLAELFDVLLVLPVGTRLSTQTAYGWLRQEALAQGGYPQQDVQPMVQALQTLSPMLPVYNDFHRVVVAHLPIVQGVEASLYKLGACQALLSGSGPAMVGLFPHGVRRHLAMDEPFPPDTYWTRWVYPADALG